MARKLSGFLAQAHETYPDPTDEELLEWVLSIWRDRDGHEFTSESSSWQTHQLKVRRAQSLEASVKRTRDPVALRAAIFAALKRRDTWVLLSVIGGGEATKHAPLDALLAVAESSWLHELAELEEPTDQRSRARETLTILSNSPALIEQAPGDAMILQGLTADYPTRASK